MFIPGHVAAAAIVKLSTETDEFRLLLAQLSECETSVLAVERGRPIDLYDSKASAFRMGLSSLC